MFITQIYTGIIIFAFTICFICCAISIILFFKYKIINIKQELSGKKAAKEINAIRNKTILNTENKNPLYQRKNWQGNTQLASTVVSIASPTQNNKMTKLPEPAKISLQNYKENSNKTFHTKQTIAEGNTDVLGVLKQETEYKTNVLENSKTESSTDVLNERISESNTDVLTKEISESATDVLNELESESNTKVLEGDTESNTTVL